jgi:predicted HAD superfamily Cof-like phosphohydrolase
LPVSTAAERLAVIQNNYNNALNNEPHDLANAKTAEDVTAIQVNLANARSAYYGAIAAQLTTSGATVEAAYEAALTAHNAVTKARDESAALAVLLQKLTGATNTATDLLKLAKTMTS